MDIKEQKQIVAALRRLEKSQLDKCFDPVDPKSRPNGKQTEIFRSINDYRYRWVVAGNQSGKSQLAGREIAWILTNTHPYWQRPSRWGEESLLIMVAGQSRTNLEELWEKKISPFLDKSEWRYQRSGGVLSYVENRITKDKILFLSHSDGSEKARAHMQGYVAHYVWLDEMPASERILEELQRRVDAREGYLIATFTPKFRNDKIRRIIDSDSSLAKKFRMSKLDNPIYKHRIAQELEALAGYSESYRRTILDGDWFTGDSAVYQFEYDEMVAAPEHYHPSWRHVESVDPASKSQFGYCMFAEDPQSGVWYLIKDEYIGNLPPQEQVEEAIKRGKGLNVMRRLYDPAAGWFQLQALKVGVNYIAPNKVNQKTDMIKQWQAALSAGQIKIAPWCSTTIDEIQGCQWSETSDRMVNSSSYHNMDCCQYFVAMMPPPDPTVRIKPWHMELREGNELRKKKNAAKKVAAGRVSSGGRVSRGIKEWGSRGARGFKVR